MSVGEMQLLRDFTLVKQQVTGLVCAAEAVLPRGAASSA